MKTSLAGLTPKPSPIMNKANLIEFESQEGSEEFKSDYSSQIYDKEEGSVISTET